MDLPVVLLVDDIKLFLDVERGFLQESNVVVLTAENGQEALDRIKVRRPDLIFMDQRMPVMDGPSCCAVIKKDPQLKHIPVVMVVASPREQDVAECRKAGCDAFLFKPVDRKVFLDIGRKYLPAVDRREKRVPCSAMVVIRFDEGEVFHGTTKDISERGIYIEFSQTVRVNDKVDISFVLPCTPPTLVEAMGRVAWVNSSRPTINPSYLEGFGIEFLQLTEESVRHVQDYVRTSAVSPQRS